MWPNLINTQSTTTILNASRERSEQSFFVFAQRSFIYLHEAVRGSKAGYPEQAVANDGLPLSHHIHSVRVG